MGFAFSTELLEWGRKLLSFGVPKILASGIQIWKDSR